MRRIISLISLVNALVNSLVADSYLNWLVILLWFITQKLGDQSQLQKCADSISEAVLDFRLALGENGFRGDLQELFNQQQVSHVLQHL